PFAAATAGANINKMIMDIGREERLRTMTHASTLRRAFGDSRSRRQLSKTGRGSDRTRFASDQCGDGGAVSLSSRNEPRK
ncbi:MAG TPA: hypothetical protein VF449_03585, partial [Parvibaculum sp.]